MPTLKKITVHSFVKEASSDSAALDVASMVLQAITNVRCSVFKSKTSIAEFNYTKGRKVSLACELKGEDMWCFLAKAVDLIMPRIKEYQGVSGGSGDGNGNLGFGFSSDVVGTFPEIEINYDS